MATHMVPQDVEADDKLVGFLSLKQFIMTVLGIGFGYLTFFFFTEVHPLSALIWLPPTLVFFVLGLYQRKDQPIEVFLSSAITFYFKPRKRKWDQEGHEDHVIITAPPKIEHHYTKDFTGEEASGRLTNLSRMMDSRGWASKQLTDWQNPQIADVADSDNRLVQPSEAPGQASPQQAYIQPTDVMDEKTSLVAKDFANKISQAESSVRSHAMEAIELARSAPESAEEPIIIPAHQAYPSMHQKVLKPVEDTPSTPEVKEDTLVKNVAKAEKTVAPEVTANKSTPKPAKKTEASTQEHVNEDGSVEISLH